MNQSMWEPARKSIFVKITYKLIDFYKFVKPADFKIGVDSLMSEMARSTGLDDFGGEEFIPVLETLAASMNEEARLNAAGLLSAKEMVKLMLKGRLRLVKLEKDRPDIFEREIKRPIFIVGGSRTGTTLLQRMLAASKNNRSPLLWEMTNSFAIVKNNPAALSAAIKKTEMSQRLLHFINPTMKAVHFSAALEPEECVLMMGTDLQNWALLSYMNLPKYSRLLSTQDFTGSYERHKKMLQMMQDSPNTQWILKAPYHLPELDALIRVYPDALIIHTHRDVVETITSTSSLYSVFRSTGSDYVDPAEVGQEQVDLLYDWFNRAMKVRKELPENSKVRFLDVRYKDLTAGPLDMVKKIYHTFDLELTKDIEQEFQNFLQNNPKSKHGKHVYTPEQFGLNPQAIREKFDSYSNAYGLD